MNPPWQVKKPLIATLDSIAMLSAGAFLSQPHWCRRPSPHECPPPGFLGNASFTLMSTLAHRKPLSIRQPAARQTYESRSAFSPFFLIFCLVRRFPFGGTRCFRRAGRSLSPFLPLLGDFETTNSLDTPESVHRGQCVARFQPITGARSSNFEQHIFQNFLINAIYLLRVSLRDIEN